MRPFSRVGFGQDLKYAVRFFCRRPVMTASALLTLSFGIGLNTAVFAFAYNVLWRELSLPESERLVYLAEVGPPPLRERTRVSAPNAADWAASAATLDGLATISLVRPILLEERDAQELSCAAVSPSFFDVIGVTPALGRLSGSGGASGTDASAGTSQRLLPRDMVISHGLWRRHFGGRTDIVGRRVQLRHYGSVEIVGVLHDGFDLSMFGAMECWFPDNRPAGRRSSRYLFAVARLAPGASVADAQAELNVIGSRLARAHPDENKDRGVAVTPLREKMTSEVRGQLWFLTLAALCVLLIVCINLLNLLLASASGRRHEFATRVALGATRQHLLGQSLAESVLLAVVGGLGGLLLAMWAVPWLVTVAPATTPRLADVGVGGTGIVYLAALTVAIGLMSGFLVSPRSSAAKSQHAPRHRAIFISLEVALALMLVITTSVLVKSMRNVAALPLGFDAANVLSVEYAPDLSRITSGPARADYERALVDEVESVPGVIVAGVGPTPLGPGLADTAVSLPANPSDFIQTGLADAGPGYFDALGARLLQGRFINAGDGPSSPPVAVISASLSRSLYPDRAVGRTLLHQGNLVEIVGVVDDIRLTDIELEPEPMLFLPSAQKSPVRADHLLVRTAGDPRTVMPQIRAALGQFDTQLPLTEITSLADRVDAATASRRFTLWLVLVFSAGALALALVGIYGVVARWVEHRIPEIGVRMALGATAGSVVRLVLRHGGAMLAVGIGAGVIGASAVSRLTSQFVFGVSPTDPASIAGASLALLAAGVGACLIPAARAARMDPAVALRQD